jgi:SNF2 family DNA or RNA helicase
MNKYLFKWNSDLFDINTLEMDEGLIRFFEDIGISDEPFEFINEENITRKFKVNWQDKTIQGRGLKGFFKPYQSNYLFIEISNDNKIKVSSFSAPNTDEVKSVIRNPEAAERTEDVLNAMSNMKQSSEIWYQLYDLAQLFQFNHHRDNLICLPHLRELNTYDYQVKTVKSVMHRLKGRALLCDEVGLGKTIEAGMTMLEYIMRGLARKILILCPPSLVQQWENEMKRKFNQDFIRSDDAAFKKMGKEAWAHYPKVIASIAMAKRKEHREIIFNQHYDLIIVDEAHHVKNRNTQAWKFVNDINKKYILLLTATPVQNHLEELYNLITLLKPGQLNTYRSFKKNFVDSKDGIEVKNVDKLKALLSDVMI